MTSGDVNCRQRLDDALNDVPDNLTFRAVCSSIDTWPNRASFPDALHRASATIESWPAKVCQVNACGDARDVEELKSAFESPSSTLIKSLHIPGPPLVASQLLDGLHDTQLLDLGVQLDEDSDFASLLDLLTAHPLQSLRINLPNGQLQARPLQKFLQHLPGSIRVLDIRLPNSESLLKSVAEFLRSQKASQLTEVTLSHAVPEGAGLFRNKSGLQVAKIKYYARLSTAELWSLHKASDFVSRIVSLGIDQSNIGDEGVDALVTCPAWRPTELQLSWNDIGPSGCDSLVSSSLARSIKTLDVAGNPLTDHGCETILRWGQGHLESLDLSDTQCSDRGMQYFGTTGGKSTLKRVVLANNEIGDDALKTIADNRRFTELTELDLQYNNIGSPGITAFSAMQWPCLQRLNLSGARASAGALAKLSRCESLARLRELIVQCARLNDSDIVALVGRPVWKRLRLLDIYESSMGDKGMEAIAASDSLSHLWSLNISNSPRKRNVTDYGIRAFSDSTTLGNLIDLSLPFTNASTAAFVQLANSPVVAHLDRVRVFEHFDVWLASESLRPVALVGIGIEKSESLLES